MGPKNKSYGVERWKACLETDLLEFCEKEGIYSGKGKGVMNDLDRVVGRLYHEKNVRTIGDLLSVPKYRFLEDEFYGRRRRAEEAWNTINRILKRHEFRMYVKPVVVRQVLCDP